MRYDRSRIMKTAHREWRLTRHRPGMTFSRCLATAWAAEKQRVNGRQHYNPEPDYTPPEVAYLFAQAGQQMRALLSQAPMTT